ncbi:hypothetical protein GCM10022245_39890 [Streptomyces mayteni]
MAEMGAFREAVIGWAAGGPGEPARELAARLPLRTAVLLEGPSDVAALDALTERRGRDLAAEGVVNRLRSMALERVLARMSEPPGGGGQSSLGGEREFLRRMGDLGWWWSLGVVTDFCDTGVGVAGWVGCGRWRRRSWCPVLRVSRSVPVSSI